MSAGRPRELATSPGVRKIPEPTMMPTTSASPSIVPSVRRSPGPESLELDTLRWPPRRYSSASLIAASSAGLSWKLTRCFTIAPFLSTKNSVGNTLTCP